MLLTHIRTLTCELPTIISICSTDKYVIVASDRSIISFHSPQTFTCLFTHDIGCSITAIEKYSMELIIVGVEDSKCIVLDLNSLEATNFDIEARFVSIRSDALVYALDAENRICCINILRNSSHKISASFETCCRPITKIAAWCCVGESVVIVDADGQCKIFVGAEFKKEFYAKKMEFTEIKHIKHSLFALVSEHGLLAVMDTAKESIICEVMVRNTALFALGIIDDKLFVAGHDNRLICYLFRDDRLLRKNQTDSHKSTVRSIHIIGERLITVSDDCTIAVHIATEHGYVFRGVIPRYDLLRTCGNRAYVNNGRNISIYEINENDETDHMPQIGYFANGYRHLASLNTVETILVFEVCKNMKYLSYSTRINTVLLPTDNLKNCLCELEPCFDLKFYDNLLCYTTLMKKIKFYNCETLTQEYELHIDNYNEKMIVLDDIILLKAKNILMDRSFNRQKLNLDFEIEHACQVGNKIYLIGYKTNHSVNTPYILGHYDIQNHTYTPISLLKQVLRLDSMVVFNGKIFCSDIERILICSIKNGTVQNHFAGKFIVGTGNLNNGLVLAQKMIKTVVRNTETDNNIKIKWKKKIKIK